MGPEYKDRERLADRWLDAAFKQYGEAHPRIGLEGRVLANLRAESERLAKRRNWRHVLAAVTAIMVVSGTMFFMRGRDVARQVVAKHEVPGVTHASGAPNSDQTIADRAAAKGRRSVDQRPRESAQTSRPARTLETAAEPRLEQFPSLQPLSDQEVALASYVAQCPHEAVVVARTQTEIRKQDELEIRQYSSGMAGALALD